MTQHKRNKARPAHGRAQVRVNSQTGNNRVYTELYMNAWRGGGGEDRRKRGGLTNSLMSHPNRHQEAGLRMFCMGRDALVVRRYNA